MGSLRDPILQILGSATSVLGVADIRRQLEEHGRSIQWNQEVNSVLYTLQAEGTVAMELCGNKPMWHIPRERTSVEELKKLMIRFGYQVPEYSCCVIDERRQCSCTLTFGDFKRTVHGKREIHEFRARVRAAHQALRVIGGAPFREIEIPPAMAEEAKRLYCIALSRGRKFSFGQELDAEDIFREYKGKPQNAGDGEQPDTYWKYQRFRTCFKEQIGRTVCGFINESIIRRDDPCPYEMIFGVDAQCKVHGILAEFSQIGSYDSKTWNETEDDIRLLFDSVMTQLSPPPTLYRIELDIQPISVSERDTTSGIPFIVIVRVPPYEEGRTSANFRGEYFVRCQASTRKVSEKRMIDVLDSHASTR